MTYLIAAANAMYPLLIRESPRTNDLIKASTIACTTLNSLVNDEDFKRHMGMLSRRASKSDPESRNQAERTLRDFHAFLAEERKVLLRNNLQTDLVDEIGRLADNIRKPVMVNRSDIGSLLVMIKSIQKDTCRLSRMLNQGINENKANGKVLNFLRKVVYLFAAVAFIELSDIPSLDQRIIIFYVALVGAILSQVVPSPEISRDRTFQPGRHFPFMKIVVPILLIAVVAAITPLSIRLLGNMNHPQPPATRIPQSYLLSFNDITGYFYADPNETNPIPLERVR